MSSLQRLSDSNDVRRYARGALEAAAVGDRLPVPLAEIASAVDLHKEALFDFGADQDLPPGIRAIMRKLKGRVLGLLDVEERRYYVDASLSVERQRFTEAHEIGHDALPWHRKAYYGEDHHTLAPDTRVSLELEANLFSAEVLFAGSRFNREADEWAPSVEVPLALAGNYQVSAAAAIRRYVAGSTRDIAVIGTGLYGGPNAARPIFDGLTSESLKFREKYGSIRDLLPAALTASVYPSLAAIGPERRGAIETCDMILSTRRGMVRFVAEGFVNGRNGLIVVSRRRRLDGQRLSLI